MSHDEETMSVLATVAEVPAGGSAALKSVRLNHRNLW